MKPLLVLLFSFFITLIIIWLYGSSWNFMLSGNIGMCIMLCFTALGHFKFTDGMIMMIPRQIPFKKAFVYITGILEIILGVLLLFERYRHIAGVMTIIFFILMLPANIYAAVNKVDYEKTTYNGKGVGYLWFRVPMQFFLILWVYCFCCYLS